MHQKKYNYPIHIVDSALNTTKKLMKLGKEGSFPFNVFRSLDIIKQVFDEEQVKIIMKKNPNVPW